MRKRKYLPHWTGDQLQQSCAGGQAHAIHENAHSTRETCPEPWGSDLLDPAPNPTLQRPVDRSQITSPGSHRLLGPNCLSNLANNHEATLPGAASEAGFLTTGEGSSQRPPEGACPCACRLLPSCIGSNLEKPLSQGGGQRTCQLVGWVGRDTNIRLSPGARRHAQQAQAPPRPHQSHRPAPRSELSC